MKKVLAWSLTASMLLSMGVLSSAAEPSTFAQDSYTALTDHYSANDYSVRVKDGVMAILQGGEVISSYDMDSSKITLVNSDDDGVAIQFKDDSGSIRKITLGSQTEVSISGKLDTLSLYSKLDKNIYVEIDSKTTIRTMKVASPSKVTIYGEVSTLEISNGKARVTVDDSGSVATVNTTNKNAIDGVPSSKVKVKQYLDEYASSSSGSSYNDEWYYDSYRGQWYNRYDGRWYDRKTDRDSYYRRYYEDGYYSVWRSEDDWGGLAVSYISVSNKKLT